MFRKASWVLAVLFLIAACAAASDTSVRFKALAQGAHPSGEALAGQKIDEATHSQLVESQDPKPLRLDFIDVGQGDCIVVGCPGGNHLLVDCGSLKGGKPDVVRAKIRSLLDQQHPKLQAVVVTHPDSDHYNMLPYALDGVTVDKVFTVAKPTEYDAATRTPRKAGPTQSMGEWLEGQAHVKTLGPKDVDPDDTTSQICDCGDARISLLAAGTKDVGAKSPKNTRSIVLMISYNKFDAILSGDATFDTEDAITDNFEEPKNRLDCELLKVGHHGSVTTSCAQEWVTATAPDVSIVSAALNNTFGHPGDKVVARLKKAAATAPIHAFRQYDAAKDPSDVQIKKAVYLTSTNGNINVVTNGSVYDLTYEK